MNCNTTAHATATDTISCLELGLGDLEDRVELGREHNVALDLELAGHEGLLRIDLAVREADERVVREVDRDV